MILSYFLLHKTIEGYKKKITFAFAKIAKL